jgi:endonuclease YncB( thermonuclease family)
MAQDNDCLINCKDREIECFNLEGQEFQAKATNIYDADTCRLVFFLNNKLVKYTVRLVGIDTPEIRPKRSVENRDQEIAAAKKARNRLIQLATDQTIDLDLTPGKKEIQKILDSNKKLITIKCQEFDKYGRLLGKLYDGDVCFNELLIEEGHAYAYDGGTKKAFRVKKTEVKKEE